jgi:hypothetical protein
LELQALFEGTDVGAFVGVNNGNYFGADVGTFLGVDDGALVDPARAFIRKKVGVAVGTIIKAVVLAHWLE